MNALKNNIRTFSMFDKDSGVLVFVSYRAEGEAVKEVGVSFSFLVHGEATEKAPTQQNTLTIFDDRKKRIQMDNAEKIDPFMRDQILKACRADLRNLLQLSKAQEN